MPCNRHPEDDPTSPTTSLESWKPESEPSLIPGLVILAHPDRGRVGERAPLAALSSGRSAVLSRLEPLFAAYGSQQRRPLALRHLSRTPLHLVPGPGIVTLERGASRTRVAFGAGKRAGTPGIRNRQTFSAAELERGVILTLEKHVVLLLCHLEPVSGELPSYGLVGDSAKTRQLRRDIRSAASLDVPVLLRGETGTGKELAARALHDHGRRRGPYVTVNMAALPASLAAAELFGAARGAYTGADRAKPGLFRSAAGGTLFLDEIGETPPEVQALLLRALETREIQPVGSAETFSVDLRVIAATDADLDSATREGRFRAPLLHRLAGYEIRLPALRERRDDVARLLQHFLDREITEIEQDAAEYDDTASLPPAGGASPWPAARLVARLTDYDWPGNVRQLRNVARRLVIARLDGAPPQELDRLLDRLLAEQPVAAPSLPSSGEPTRADPSEPRPPISDGPWVRRYRSSSDVDENELLATLETHGWRLRPTARALGISRGTLYRMIEASPRIRKPADLSRTEIETALAHCKGDRQAAARKLRVSPPGLKRRMTELGMS